MRYRRRFLCMGMLGSYGLAGADGGATGFGRSFSIAALTSRSSCGKRSSVYLRRA